MLEGKSVVNDYPLSLNQKFHRDSLYKISNYHQLIGEIVNGILFFSENISTSYIFIDYLKFSYMNLHRARFENSSLKNYIFFNQI